MDADTPILYFDGVCNLCNGAVRFFIRHDKKKQFRFASLQSAAGQKAITQAALQGVKADSVLLFHKGHYYFKSKAVISALTLLGGFWKIATIALLVPQFIRDMVYGWIANNRYRWFGKRDECMLPTEELRGRFLDGAMKNTEY